MKPDISLAAIPLNTLWCERDSNLQALSDSIAALPEKPDVAVIPELFSTGFISDPDTAHEMAETTAETTMQTVRLLAATHRMAISGSFLCRDGRRLVNRAFFVEPGGDEVFYDKRHLFCLSDESKILVPGSYRPPIFRFRGWNFSMAVCYDLRFPVWCRNSGPLYDILLVPANWPDARAFAWQQLLSARAIENQAVVIGANRSGRDSAGSYDGQTFIIDPLGHTIASSPGKALPAIARISGTKFEKLRTDFPVASDADQFNI